MKSFAWHVRPMRRRCGCVARRVRRIAAAYRRAGRDAAKLSDSQFTGAALSRKGG